MITFVPLPATAYCRLCRQRKEVNHMIVKGTECICYACERILELDGLKGLKHD